MEKIAEVLGWALVGAGRNWRTFAIGTAVGLVIGAVIG